MEIKQTPTKITDNHYTLQATAGELMALWNVLDAKRDSLNAVEYDCWSKLCIARMGSV